MGQKQILAILGLSSVLFLGYQNCSKVGVSDLENNVSQKPMGNFEQVLDEDAKEAMQDAPVADMPVVEMPGRPSKDKDKEPRGDMPPSPRPPIVKDQEPVEMEEPSEEEVANLCIKAKDNKKSQIHRRKSAEVEAGTISNLRGYHVVESDLINLIENVRGKLIVKAKSDGAIVKSIVDIRGALIICGMDIDSIENTRGHIVLVNSRVKNMSNHRGNVKLLGSEILNTSDMRGNISEIKPK